jgi:hypothetical protein
MTNLAEMNELPSSPSTRPLSQWFDPAPGLGISLIDHLFNRLDGAYPHKWRSNFANQQAIDNWAESWVEAFEEEGITPSDVKAGLRECRKRFAWPPSCAEFVQACRPSLDPMKAYYEGVAGVQARAAGEYGKWSHPAIYWAAMPLAFDLGNQTFSQIKPRWEAALFEQLDKGEWQEIPQAMVALPAPAKATTSREEASRRLRELGATSVAKSGVPGNTGWAREILKREAEGEAFASPIIPRFAREALGIQ